jgi:hypothetical protein
MQIKVYWCGFCGGPLKSAEVRECPHCHVGLRDVQDGSHELYLEARKRFARRKREIFIGKVMTPLRFIAITVPSVLFKKLFFFALGLTALGVMSWLLCLGFRKLFVYYHGYAPTFAFTLVSPAIFFGAAGLTEVILWFTNPWFTPMREFSNISKDMNPPGLPLSSPIFLGNDLNDDGSQAKKQMGNMLIIVIWVIAASIFCMLAGMRVWVP